MRDGGAGAAEGGGCAGGARIDSIHTAGSQQSDQVDLKVVRDNLGHANIATTNTYVHAEDDARHDVTNLAHRAGWSVR